MFSVNQINRELDRINSQLWLIENPQEVIAEKVGIDTGGFRHEGFEGWPR